MGTDIRFAKMGAVIGGLLALLIEVGGWMAYIYTDGILGPGWGAIAFATGVAATAAFTSLGAFFGLLYGWTS